MARIYPTIPNLEIIIYCVVFTQCAKTTQQYTFSVVFEKKVHILNRCYPNFKLLEFIRIYRFQYRLWYNQTVICIIISNYYWTNCLRGLMIKSA